MALRVRLRMSPVATQKKPVFFRVAKNVPTVRLRMSPVATYIFLINLDFDEDIERSHWIFGIYT